MELYTKLLKHFQKTVELTPQASAAELATFKSELLQRGSMAARLELVNDLFRGAVTKAVSSI